VKATNLEEPMVLTVEDDEGHAILIRQNLEASGCCNRITHFNNGQAVLDFFFNQVGAQPVPHRNAYVVLLDIRLPKVNGIDVLRRLREEPALHHVPVIMLTTADDDIDVARCYEIGCSAYIRKPVEYDDFAETIHRIARFINLLLVPASKLPAC
jgi:CheY-like chemotaxis protein